MGMEDLFAFTHQATSLGLPWKALRRWTAMWSCVAGGGKREVDIASGVQYLVGI
jgi:hypothetical protein